MVRPALDVVVDFEQQRVGMPVRLPVHGEIAVITPRWNSSGLSGDVVLVGGGLRASRCGAGRRCRDQRCRPPARAAAAYPCRRRWDRPPARAARADRARLPGRHGRGPAHATRPPSRQTLRTTGTRAGDVHADEIGALADRDLAAVGEPHRLGRRLGHGADRRGQADRGHVLAAIAARPSAGSTECSRTTGYRAGLRARDRPRRCCRSASRRAPRSARPSRCRCRPRCRPRAASTVVGNPPPPRRRHARRPQRSPRWCRRGSPAGSCSPMRERRRSLLGGVRMLVAA